MSEWFEVGDTALLSVVLSAIGIYAALIIATRVAGLRSFSKMSSFDFALTIAVGSIIATVVVSEDPPLAQGVVGLLSLYVLQYIVAWGRKRSHRFSWLVTNEPLLLVRNGVVLHENLDRARISEDDLRAKLREANVRRLQDVKAVIMETTADISVVHGEGPDMEDYLLDNVRTS